LQLLVGGARAQVGKQNDRHKKPIQKLSSHCKFSCAGIRLP
jgi:hypothetical protein